MPAYESGLTVQQDQLSQDLASLKIDRGPKVRAPRRVPGWLWALVILGTIAVVGYYVVYPRLRSALVTSEVRTGTIALVSPDQAQVQLTATGYVVALVYAKVAAKVPGRIAEIFVEEGQVIEKDSKVARLEDVDFKSGLAASRARGAAARAKIQIARATLAETRVMYEREKPLVEKGVTAKATLDDLQAKIDSLTAAVRAAEAEAMAAEAETKALEVQLGSYLIVSPIKGTVVDKLVEVGEGVSPGFGTPGVVEVVDMDSLVVEVDVPEGRLSLIADGAPAEIVLDADTAQRYAGKVKEIGRRVNRSKATVPIKVAFVDKPKLVLPDMAARVSFLAKPIDEASKNTPPKLIVPASAVVQRAGADVIFIVDDEEVRMTTVEVGGEFAGGRELETKIPPGTKVVLSPAADLVDGTKVKEKR
jgi:RND family efflux transporter MFP subunit